MDWSFVHYLSSKRSVDDRALNLRVWDRLKWEAGEYGKEKPLTILEAGAGTGSMLERLLEWNLVDQFNYLGIDEIPGNIQAAIQQIPVWAETHGWKSGQREEGGFLSHGNRRAQYRFEAVDVFEFIPRHAGYSSWDLIIANAFLDLVDVPAALPELIKLAHPGSWLYLTINFDGVTIFEPALELDEVILAAYHKSMDDRIIEGKRSGDSQTGRKLFGWLRDASLDVLEAGSSDWVVFSRGGTYPGDEVFFLETILHFFEESLTDCVEVKPDHLRRWLAERRDQLKRGELVYIAHQMDFLAQVPK